MGQREDLSTIGERHGSLTGTVEGGEEIYKEGDQSRSKSSLIRGDECAKPGGQEGPRHLREGKEQQGSSTKGIDGPECREGKNEIDRAEDEREGKGLILRCTGLLKNAGRIKCDNVDATHLLGNHDRERRQGGATHTRNCEELDKTGGVRALSNDMALNLKHGVNLVHVAGGLNRVVS